MALLPYTIIGIYGNNFIMEQTYYVDIVYNNESIH